MLRPMRIGRSVTKGTSRGAGTGSAGNAIRPASSTSPAASTARRRRNTAHPPPSSANRGRISHHAPRPSPSLLTGGTAATVGDGVGVGVGAGSGVPITGAAVVASGTRVADAVGDGEGVGDGRGVADACGVGRGVGDARTGDGRLMTGGGGVGTGLGVGVGDGVDGSTNGAVIASSRVGGTSCAPTGMASGRSMRAAARKGMAMPVASFVRHASTAATKRATRATDRSRRIPFDISRRAAYIADFTTGSGIGHAVAQRVVTNRRLLVLGR